MKFTETKLKDLYIVETEPYADERGLFFRAFCKKEFRAIGLKKEFVQINQSVNYKKGTFRGLHYNNCPSGDDKLIRCISGKVFDIIVDLRRSSKTFLKYVAIELSSENKKMLFVPSGFAHGFITLEDNTQLIYHHTSYYQPECEAGIHFNDPKIKLKLPRDIEVITQKDLYMPFMTDEFNGV